MPKTIMEIATETANKFYELCESECSEYNNGFGCETCEALEIINRLENMD